MINISCLELVIIQTYANVTHSLGVFFLFTTFNYNFFSVLFSSSTSATSHIPKYSPSLWLNCAGASINWANLSVPWLGSPIKFHFPLVVGCWAAGQACFFSPCLPIWQQINSQRSLMCHTDDTSNLFLQKDFRKLWVSRQILWQWSFIWRVSEAWVLLSNLCVNWRKSVEVKNTRGTICLVDSSTFGQTLVYVELWL